MTHEYIVTFAVCIDADNQNDAKIKAVKRLFYKSIREKSVTQINDLTTGEIY